MNPKILKPRNPTDMKQRPLWIPEEAHEILDAAKRRTFLPKWKLALDAIREKHQNKKPLTRAAKHNEI